MVGVEAALEIRVLHRHGKSVREIAVLRAPPGDVSRRKVEMSSAVQS
jgi:hypothetical protein